MDTSGGFGLSSLKGKTSGLKGKLSGKVQGAKDKAATAALMGSMSSMNPFGKKGKSNPASMLGSLTSTTGTTPAQSGSKLTLALKVIIFVVATLFISLFAIYTIKKNHDFNTNNILKIVFVSLILIVALFAAAWMKNLSLTLDILISSEINILCFYMILTYTTLTTLFSDGIFNALKTSFSFIKNIASNPTSMFENSGATFIPVFFFIIPSIILLYNMTQGMTQFLLILALTLGTGAVMLWPKDWSVGG